MIPSLAFLGETHNVMPQSPLYDCQWWQWLESTQRRWHTCNFGFNSTQNQQHGLWGWKFVSKQLQPRVTFFYCSGWCEPSQMSGFQSLPSLAQYWLMTGSLLAVWAVHTLYQPVGKGRKGKWNVSEKSSIYNPTKTCLFLAVGVLHETLSGWEKGRTERILPSSSCKQMPWKGRPNSKAGQRTPESEQSWISLWLPGLQHTWKGWSSDWWSIGKLNFYLETYPKLKGFWWNICLMHKEQSLSGVWRGL